MITDNELNEIKEYLEKAENPLIFFDDDHDGLASYLLFKRKYEKCHGIIVRGGMKDEEIYFRKIKEYNPDTIFILDRAEISQELIDFANVPLIWIDHHPVLDRKGAKYYNPRIHDKNDNRPVSYWCYNIVKKDLWIALIGMTGDHYIPKELVDKFEYKGLFNGQEKIEDIIFNSDVGKLIKIFNFILKGTTTDVRKNINILSKIESPYEILNQENSSGKHLYKFYEKINEQYIKLLERAKKNIINDKIILYTYPDTKVSLSSGLADEIRYHFPNKVVIVAREKDDYMRVSLRSNHVILPPLVKKALDGLDGYGGGHDQAVGASVNKKDFPKFIENIKKYIDVHDSKNSLKYISIKN